MTHQSAGLRVSSTQHSDSAWGRTNLLSNGYRGKATGAWSYLWIHPVPRL